MPAFLVPSLLHRTNEDDDTSGWNGVSAAQDHDDDDDFHWLSRLDYVCSNARAQSRYGVVVVVVVH